MNLTTLLAAFLAGGLAGFLLANLGWAHSRQDRDGERTREREDGVRVTRITPAGDAIQPGCNVRPDDETTPDEEDRTAAMWALERELEDEP